MTYRDVAVRLRAGAGWCVALLGLSIPISTGADNVLLALVVLAWIAALPVDWRASWRAFVSTPPLVAAAVFFAALVIGIVYSPVPASVAWSSSASKYSELVMMIALVWAAVSERTRRLALYFFLTAIVLNLIVSYSVGFELVQGYPGLRTYPAYPIGFRLSVTHNILVSLAAFAGLLLAREARKSMVRAGWIAFTVICAYNVLFMVIGRTGYVLLAVLVAYFFVTSIRGWRGPVACAVVLACAFPAAYFGSANFHSRVEAIASDLSTWQPGAGDSTSVGQRVGYYRTSAQIVADHPLTGVGTGGFADAYAAKVKGTDAPATTNPHNDYLIAGVQLGVPGMLLMLVLYGTVWRSARHLPSRVERDLARGVVLTMAIGGLFNSVLLDHTEGLLFAWAIAVLFAGYRRYSARRDEGGGMRDEAELRSTSQ
ncbi:MAG: O-Antigen polymerase [Betaproteobacteria bacterium]|nr:O-Antigen polymerase [Betaproteobacteria bacterium]